MPCVFDNDSFERDFESALMRDWSSDITDYDMPAEDSPIKTPSDSIKRKSSDENEVESQSKKTRFESSVPPLSSDLVSSSSSTDDLCRSGYSSVSPFLESSSRPTTVDSSTSTSANASSSTESHEDDSSVVEVEEEDYMPRRRPYQMWTSGRD
ncbi:SERTA domain-containing protein [Caerostris extrusa]|uniref:SERTA domain-containing protein n=1 Tax=Caerostris extrusa TaxID=172846 RepID=A0AAV4NFV1_CAEEX|nr:SERTA domain-containing protein [Caerostris extrusa]